MGFLIPANLIAIATAFLMTATWPTALPIATPTENSMPVSQIVTAMALSILAMTISMATAFPTIATSTRLQD